MKQLLIKAFVKNPTEHTNPQVRQAYGMLGGTVGMLCNILMSLIKFVVGILSGSVAFISDGLHNLMDAAASVITLITFKFSNRPADNHHSFGHGRIEYLSGLTISVLIILIGAELMKTSVTKILHPTPVTYTIWSFVVFVTSVIIQVWLSAFVSNIGKLIDSDAMKATGRDYMSDCIGTIAVLIGAVIAKIFNLQLDGYLGAMVSCFILFTGITSVKETIQPLLGTKPDPEFIKEIVEQVKLHEEVQGIHDMVVHDYGPTRRMVTFHAEVPSHMDMLAAHEVIDDIEGELREKYGCTVTIHMDPIDVDNPVVAAMRETTTTIVEGVNDQLKIHDFRMVKGNQHSNLIFDMVIPYGMDQSDEDIVAEVKQQIQEKNPNCFAVIEVDHEYVAM